MMLKTMATVPAVIVAAAVNCGCSAIPSSGLQAQNTYGATSYGATSQVAPGPAVPARVQVPVPYAAVSPTVEVPGERVIGADPDANVRFELLRNAGFYLHGGGSN
jgi:hypothetical protein